MRLSWSDEAVDDIEGIAIHLSGEFPFHAERLVTKILLAIAKLPDFPERGRPGKKSGTRELILAPLPYIVVYTESRNEVQIVRILHGAQRWP